VTGVLSGAVAAARDFAAVHGYPLIATPAAGQPGRPGQPARPKQPARPGQPAPGQPVPGRPVTGSTAGTGGHFEAHSDSRTASLEGHVHG
jgi:hypothetical protein